MISVITSTFHRPQLLKRAIESVQAQTFTDWEMIIVNDDPDHETKSIVESFNDKRLTYIAMGSKFGCDTRPKNRGIQSSTGEYIAFLDDDSVYRPDHLQALYNELKRGEVDVVYGDRWIFEEEKSVSIGIFHEFDPFLMMRRNYIDTSDVLCKKEAIVEVGGFDEKYKKYVDWNLWVRMMKAGYKFKRVPLVLTDYHVYPHSKSNRKEDEKGFSQPAWDSFSIDIHVPHLSPEREPKVGIFTLTYDRLEMTKKSFESLWETAEYPFEHLVIDNGSADGTVEWLDEYQLEHKGRVSTKKYAKNHGISIASNYAIDSLKDCDIIVKVDNDALFLTKGWLKRMVELWKSNRMLIMSPYIQGLKDNPGGAPRQDYGMIKGEYLGLTRHIGGIVHFADARAYRDFRWSKDDTLHGMQDLELSNYLNKSGYLHAYMENFNVEHMYGTEGQHKMYPDYFRKRSWEKSHVFGEKYA
jgi:glycosyltransferase involved in cell wall biosynthesis